MLQRDVAAQSSDAPHHRTASHDEVHMPHGIRMQRASTRFEAAVILVLQLFMMIVIATALFELFKILYSAFSTHLLHLRDGGPDAIRNVGDLQRVLQRAFGGVLLVLLGLELLDTLRNYFTEHRLRLEIILVVAIIAVGRHIILLDFEHLDGWTLGGIALLVLALTGGYFLIRKMDAAAARPADAEQT